MAIKHLTNLAIRCRLKLGVFRGRWIVLSLFAALCSPCHAGNEAALAEFLIPAEENIYPAQIGAVTAQEYRELRRSNRRQLEGESDGCFSNVPTEAYRKFDFSGDGIADVLFTTLCGQEEHLNYFWVRRGTDYVYAGKLDGTVVKFTRFGQQGPYSVVLRYGWCCVSWQGKVELYELAAKDGGANFVRKAQFAEFSGIVVPAKRLPPVSFVIGAEQYRLRSEPVVNDKPTRNVISDMTGKSVFGNIVAEYPKGSRGVRIAETADATGRIWWFVIMDETAKPLTTHFLVEGLRVGWMSSKYLEAAN